MSDAITEIMHVVTIEWAIALDDEVPLRVELNDLMTALQGINERCEGPQGSWRVVSVGLAEDLRDLDPCYNNYPPVPGWPEGPEA